MRFWHNVAVKTRRLHTGDGEALFPIEAPRGASQLTPYDPAFEEKMTKAEDIIGRCRILFTRLAS